MPTYDVNNEDVDLLLDALQNYLVNNDFQKHPTRIVSLKNRLLSKVKLEDLDLIKPEDLYLDELDVWSPFQLKETNKTKINHSNYGSD
jgi:hypothetical protein